MGESRALDPALMVVGAEVKCAESLAARGHDAHAAARDRNGLCGHEPLTLAVVLIRQPL